MTASDDSSFRSITGVPESAEPASTTTPQPSKTQAGESSTNRAQPPPSASDSGPVAPMRHQNLSGLRSLNVSGSPSTANSPMSSRDASPTRPPQRQPASSGPLPKPGLRSRKNSTDVSPSRGPGLAGSSTTVLSAAAIQRALSNANIPQLPPNSTQDPSRVPRPQKTTSGTNSGESTPHWPISPRLKSPPPSETRSRSRRNSLRNQPKKSDSTSTPSIIVQSSSPAPASRIPVKDESPNSDPEEQALSMKASSRGTSGAAPKLETVQEGSLPTTPGFERLDVQSVPSTAHGHKSSDEERNDVATSKVTEDLSVKSARHNESGSDTGAKKDNKGKMQEQRSASTQRPTILPSKASFSSLSAIKSRTEAPTRNMTVETETVPSIAQATIGNQERSASGRADGSLRLKPSNETIRPKKEKQKPKRKAPSINAGTASSKADVFEQKVASAVDEANSSDSDATFIYESNPPDQQQHRARHHSRTPSMTSIASIIDPRAAIIRDTHKNPGKKTSMKFANPYNTNTDGDAPERGDGTIRIGSGRVSGGAHHHHIGRHGQGRGALNHIALDSDSSFAQPSRARGASSRHTSQPNSPRFHTFNIGNGSANGNGSKKHSEYSAYDIDTENAADDERTPLIQSVRSPRTRTPRQPRNNPTSRQLERHHRRSGGWCRTVAGCLVLSILVLVVLFMIVGLIFAATKPLSSVRAREIQNVIASQEELMLDLVVDAVNPNVVAVTIADMDVNIFAKSKHVGSDKWWREHGRKHHNQEDWQPIKALATPTRDVALAQRPRGVDEGTDPIDDPDIGEPRIMLLGRISHFDSPLTFEGSFWNRHSIRSIGEMRLSKPGNKTEAGGTERWEEVLQYPFELIVRGVFKYQLPLSSREHTVSITASYFYDPDAEKKKLKTALPKLSRNLFSKSVKIPPVFGRYDLRGRSLPLLES